MISDLSTLDHFYLKTLRGVIKGKMQWASALSPSYISVCVFTEIVKSVSKWDACIAFQTGTFTLQIILVPTSVYDAGTFTFSLT